MEHFSRNTQQGLSLNS